MLGGAWKSGCKTDLPGGHELAIRADVSRSGFDVDEDLPLLAAAISTTPSEVASSGSSDSKVVRLPASINSTRRTWSESGRDRTGVAAGDILGDTWDQYTEDVISKIGRHLRFCDLLGVRRAL